MSPLEQFSSYALTVERSSICQSLSCGICPAQRWERGAAPALPASGVLRGVATPCEVRVHEACPLFPIHRVCLTRSRSAWRCMTDLLEQVAHSSQ